MSAKQHTQPPIAVHQLELTQPWDLSRRFGEAYHQVDLLLRCLTTPVGVVRVDLHDGHLRRENIEAAIASQPDIGRRIEQLKQQAFLLQQHPSQRLPLTWSLIICTRDRSADLQRCLESLMQAKGIETGEVIVVDNAPSNDETKNLLAHYPFRYIRTQRGGQNHARATGSRAASGQVLLFTDDDTVVDRHWIEAMLAGFDSPCIGAVTGLTLPIELETEAQHLFHQYGGHGRGFDELCHDRNTLTPAAAGRMGNGANMAIRRELVVNMQMFDVEMDGGTATLSGGDTYALYGVLSAGFAIRYTPKALIRHRDRRELAGLQRMLFGYSVGVFAFLSRILERHLETDAIVVGWSWLFHHHLKQTLRCLLRRPGAIPLKLLWMEWRGVCVGPIAYLRSRRVEQQRAEANAT